MLVITGGKEVIEGLNVGLEGIIIKTHFFCFSFNMIEGSYS